MSSPTPSDIAITYTATIICEQSDNRPLPIFEATQHVPASLLSPPIDQTKTSTIYDLISHTLNEHNKDILRIFPKSCIMCDKPAREILHSAIPFFVARREQKPLLGYQDSEDAMWDFAMPICEFHGVCDVGVRIAVQEALTSDAVLEDIMRRQCDVCRKKMGVRKCRGCGMFEYCSSECSGQSWEVHRRKCCEVWQQVKSDLQESDEEPELLGPKNVSDNGLAVIPDNKDHVGKGHEHQE